MSQRFYGSICITDLVDLAHKKHSAFTKGDNGKIYANINVWLNDEKDKYGNVMALQLSPKKELKELDGQPYFGNCKESEQKVINTKDASGLSLPEDIPGKEKASPGSVPNPDEIKEPLTDLPF